MGLNESSGGGTDGRTGTMARDSRPDQERRTVGDIAAGANDNERNEPRERLDRVAPRRRGGGLRFYKPSQGYYTRIWTAVGGTILVLWGGASLFDQLTGLLDPGTRYYYPVSYGVTVAFVLALAAVLYWLVGLSRKANEFFIATEGEMKKVSWSSRKEVIRSTKVVITTVVLLGTILFVVDLAFMWFFSAINVLKAFSGFSALFGGGKS